MNKTAIFPGSFSPFTLGHKSVVDRALPLFDKIIIAIGINSEKDEYFSIEERENWINSIYKNNNYKINYFRTDVYVVVEVGCFVQITLIYHTLLQDCCIYQLNR